MTKHDLYWLAGLLEGEGHFHVHRYQRRSGSFYECAYLRLEMGDRDIVERARDLLGGIGSICAIRPKNPKHSTMYAWTIYHRNAENLLIAILPLMGERRQQQISKVLDTVFKLT